MIAPISNQTMTPEEYLAFEETSDIKHEYVNGEVYAMSGSTDDHNTIAQNVQVTLRAHTQEAQGARYSKVRMHSYFASRVACCYITVLADESVLSNSTDTIYISDVKVHPPTSNYDYPDVSVWA